MIRRAEAAKAAEEALARGDRWAAVMAVAPLALARLRKILPPWSWEDAEQTYYLEGYKHLASYQSGRGMDPVGYVFAFVLPRTCATLIRTNGPLSGGRDAARLGRLNISTVTLDTPDAVSAQPVGDPWPRVEAHVDAERVLARGNLTPKQRAAMLAWDQGTESRLISAHRAMGLGKLRPWATR